MYRQHPGKFDGSVSEEKTLIKTLIKDLKEKRKIRKKNPEIITIQSGGPVSKRLKDKNRKNK